MGNPPYYQNSKNNLPEIINLLATYKPSNEQNIQPLNNDYIKFMRFAQWKLLERYNPAESAPLVLDSRQGIMGFITPNSYIWGRTHRKMREFSTTPLIESISSISTAIVRKIGKKMRMCLIYA